MLQKIKAFHWQRAWRALCALTFTGETIAVLVHPNISHAFVALAFLIVLTGQDLEDAIRERHKITIDKLTVDLHQYICVDEEGKPIVITRREPIKTS